MPVTEGGGHAHASCAGGRDHGGSDRGDEPGRRASRRRGVHGVRPDALPAGRDGDRRGVRLSVAAAAGAPRPRAVLRLPRDDQQIVPPGGETHPRRRDPPRDVRRRAEPAEVVRAEGLVHGPGRDGRLLLRRHVQRPVHDAGIQGTDHRLHLDRGDRARRDAADAEPTIVQPDLRAASRREEAGQGDGRAARAVRCPRPGALVDGERDERDGGSARRRASGGEHHERASAQAVARPVDRHRPRARALRARGVDRRPEAASRVSTRPSGNPPGGAPSRATTGSTGSDA